MAKPVAVDFLLESTPTNKQLFDNKASLPPITPSKISMIITLNISLINAIPASLDTLIPYCVMLEE
jgi:hypothetical protein